MCARIPRERVREVARISPQAATWFLSWCLLCVGCGSPASPTSNQLVIYSPTQIYVVGQSYTLTATFHQAGIGDEDVSTQAVWMSSDQTVVQVNRNVITVLRDGRADVTAVFQQIHGSLAVSAGVFVVNAGPGVSTNDQDRVRNIVSSLALPYLASTFGWHPTEQIVINLQVGGVTAEGEAASASATARFVTIDVSSQGWCCIAHNDAYQRRTVVHELFHVLQYSIGWLPSHTRAVWLVEGSAEYVAYRAVVIDVGLAAPDDVRACKQRGVLLSQPPVPALAALEGQTAYTLSEQTGFVYADAYLGVERATSRSGLMSLIAFGEMSSSLADSFQAALGEPLADFYTEFEQYRAGWQLQPVPPGGCY